MVRCLNFKLLRFGVHGELGFGVHGELGFGVYGRVWYGVVWTITLGQVWYGCATDGHTCWVNRQDKLFGGQNALRLDLGWKVKTIIGGWYRGW